MWSLRCSWCSSNTYWMDHRSTQHRPADLWSHLRCNVNILHKAQVVQSRSWNEPNGSMMSHRSRGEKLSCRFNTIFCCGMKNCSIAMLAEVYQEVNLSYNICDAISESVVLRPMCKITSLLSTWWIPGGEWWCPIADRIPTAFLQV